MKKILFFILVVFAIVFWGAWIYRAEVISIVLSKKIQTELTIKTIDFSKGALTLSGFALKNPKGFVSMFAMTTDDVKITFSKNAGYFPSQEIDELIIQNGVCNIDCTNTLCQKNNWTEIVKKAKGTSKSKPVRIQRVILENFTVYIHATGLIMKDQQIHFDRLELTNISSDMGFPTKLLIQEIFKQAGLDQYLKGGLQKATESLLKKFF